MTDQSNDAARIELPGGYSIHFCRTGAWLARPDGYDFGGFMYPNEARAFAAAVTPPPPAAPDPAVPVLPAELVELSEKATPGRYLYSKKKFVLRADQGSGVTPVIFMADDGNGFSTHQDEINGDFVAAVVNWFRYLAARARFEAPEPPAPSPVEGDARPGLKVAAAMARNMADAKEYGSRGGLGSMFANQTAFDLRSFAAELDRVSAQEPSHD